MQALVRSSFRQLARAPGQVRNMSGAGGATDLATEIKEMNKWRNVTLFLGIPGSTAFAIYCLSQPHEHYHKPERPYLNIRNKPFPWGDCALFDQECKKGAAH